MVQTADSYFSDIAEEYDELGKLDHEPASCFWLCEPCGRLPTTQGL